MIHRLEHDKFRLVAANKVEADYIKWLAQNPPTAGRGSVSGRAVAERATIHIPDVLADPEYARTRSEFTEAGPPTHHSRRSLAARGCAHRRNRVAPHKGAAVYRQANRVGHDFRRPSRHRNREHAAVRGGAGADRELQESLEYQTAISDVLGVISRSPSEVQPVLETIAKTARRLCEADRAIVLRLEKDRFLPVARDGIKLGPFDKLMDERPPAADGTTVAGRAVAEKRAIHIEDFRAEPQLPHLKGVLGDPRRTMLGVPLFRDETALGAIVLTRTVVRPFAQQQIDLVTTFADQAVIAIENARLLKASGAHSELQESLQQQTATADVLKVISRSTFDLQTVLDTLTKSAARLCHADKANIARVKGDAFQFVAFSGFEAEYREYMKGLQTNRVDRGSITGRTVLEGRIVHVPDVLADPEFTWFEAQKRGGFRTGLGVPLLRERTPIGVFFLTRNKVDPFTQPQIELVTSFADQAVIAIENTRLFEEVQARNRDLTALSEVGRAVSLTLDLKVVLKTIVDRAVELSATDGGSIFYYREEVGAFELGETSGFDEEVVARFRNLDILASETGLGEAIAKRQPLQIPDVSTRARNPLRDAALEAGLRAALIVPLIGAEGPLGALVLRRRHSGEFSETVISLMQAFADQSAIALENARLFEEIARKSRELEVASQHKSQFVANMSHELRTPLAAMLGYAELLRDGMFGELPEKSIRIIERVQANGKHLLGLINTVLDISKIESGQFKLSLVEYSLDSMVETVRVATESLASAKKLSFRTDVVKGLPYGLGDEPRLTQVLLNLVGNAIKFTDAGEVCISADAKNGSFVVSVSDTGPGIPYEERERIFDKFHQVDSTSTKTKGGTGLGLAIAKEIIEMHGGRISVESIVGRGSTFRMELPVRAQASGAAA